jgi:hypothetical protein
VCPASFLPLVSQALIISNCTGHTRGLPLTHTHTGMHTHMDVSVHHVAEQPSVPVYSRHPSRVACAHLLSSWRAPPLVRCLLL